MDSIEKLKQSLREFIDAIEEAKERLDVRCGLWFDIVWYRQEKHNVRLRWKVKKGMYRRK